MALSDSEIQKAKDLKAQGYSTKEIKGFLGAERVGMQSPVHNEITQRQNPTPVTPDVSITERLMNIVGAPAEFLVPDAVDVFGDSIARSKLGSQLLQSPAQERVSELTGKSQQEINQQAIADPTRQQKLGAVLQTAGLAADVGITVGSLGAGSALTLGRNVALGAGLGYMYDVGEDMIEQQRLAEIVDPDFGTAVGAASPLLFAGIGAGYRYLRPAGQAVEGIADDVARAAAPAVREATQETTEDVSTSPSVSGAIEKTREFAQRFPRAAQRTQESLEDAAVRRELREIGGERVGQAIDSGLETRTITRVTEAPDVQKDAYKQVVLAAEGADPRTAEIVAGRNVVDMYEIARSKQQEVGERLGAAREMLGNDPVPFGQEKRTFLDVMRANGINLQPNAQVSVRGKTDAEERVISQVWRQLSKYDLDNITPKEINEIDQLLSKIERETPAIEKIQGVYINVPEQNSGKMVPQNVFRYIRDTFDNKLQQLDETGEIAELKREYANIKNTTSELENTWFSNLNTRTSTTDELATAAANALRRPDSRAKSGVQYQQMYNRLDLLARANDYQGANALDVSNFYLKEVEPLYRDTTPPASATGIFGGARQAIADVINVGGVTQKDKQKGLRTLLEIDDAAPTPKADDFFEPEVKESLGTRIKNTLTDQSGSLRNPLGSGESDLQRLGSLRESSAKINRLNSSALDTIEDYINLVEGGQAAVGVKSDPRQVREAVTVIAKELGIEPTPAALREVLDARLDPAVRKAKQLEVGKAQSATTKTTDLVEEARKYKSADEFVKAQGEPVYHATDSAEFNPADFDTSKSVKADDLFFNPLGDGMYVSSNQDFVRKFGSNRVEMYLDPKAKIKEVTIDSWEEGFDELLNNILEDLDISFSDLTQTERGYINRLVPDTPINSMNQLEDILQDAADRKGITKSVQKTIQEVVDAENEGFDAVRYMDTDYYTEADETVIKNRDMLKTRSQLEDIWKQANE